MNTLVQSKDHLFGVVYDDETIGDEAEKNMSLVKFLVTTVERELKAVDTDEHHWRGYYTTRDALPGENKMRRYISIGEKCQYIICVINRNFITKGLPRFYTELNQYLQSEKDESRLINVFYGMSLEEADELKNMDGQLECLKQTESILIPEQYENNPIEWTSQIIQSLTSK